MASFLVLTLLLVPMNVRATWSANYAVDCPESCNSSECKNPQHCKRTVLDDCGCCRVCAAALGETCYRTVAGMDGVKCGPGLKCQFFSEEDDFGDEFGICKECPYGTYGLDCLRTCSCPSGICDRVTGKCVKFSFFQLAASKPPHQRKILPPTENDMGSGDGNSVEEDFVKEKDIHSPIMKWLNPR
ncbi:PREDICTED: endothelial cell-specific molecule 1 [Thamnophis sirtalis]|uniref:Endothelial cell-specific molecule 1 n=1 Tax=Thamnophis sirtalis TaxID=35019 RepID=A0A6I9XW92_9SAUR|nr:PREDICTED: endothelial cell-specific molecule 1 [Thamnophis sirtalis]